MKVDGLLEEIRTVVRHQKMGLNMTLLMRGVLVTSGRLQIQVMGARGEVLQRPG